MVFGVFDGLHEGHKFFLREAKKFGGFLTVVVTKDKIVERMKGKSPRQGFTERKSLLEKETYIDEILEGDEEMDSWRVFEKCKPDIIALGFDQIDLKKSLEIYLTGIDWTPEIKIINSFKPEKYKSSLIKF